jgi:hypothetical protein
MPHAPEDHDDLLRSLEPEFAIIRDFLSLRTGDPTLAEGLLRNALATTLCARADAHLTPAQFSIEVLKAALRSLRGRDVAVRARARHARIDLPTVLADGRELPRSMTLAYAMVERVIDSFARASQRDIVREVWSEDVGRNDVPSETALPRRALASLLLRANRRLRLAMHQQQTANVASDGHAILSTIVNIARWPLRRRIEQIAIDSGHASTEVDAWFADWLQRRDVALNELRPDDCLRTRAGRERLTDEYLGHLIPRERDRLQLRRLLLEGASGELTARIDDAYFEELLRDDPRD